MTGTARVTEVQYNYLTHGIDPRRVRELSGKGSHVEAWDIRRTLIRVFGFGGFDIEDRGTCLVKEIENPPGSITYGSSGKTNNRTVWTVVYRVSLRLIVKDAEGREIAHFDDAATGDAVNQPSLGDAHDLAVKTAHSQALKRCATNLGDQFGLSLYNNGSRNPVVIKCAVSPIAAQPAPQPDDAPAVDGGEMDEPRSGDDGDDGRQVERAESSPASQMVPAQAQAPAAKVGPSQDAMNAACLLAQAAARAGERNRLLGILTEARNKKLLVVHVESVISPAEAAVVGLSDPPVTLEQWVTACGTYVNAHPKVSVFTASKTVTEGAAQ